VRFQPDHSRVFTTYQRLAFIGLGGTIHKYTLLALLVLVQLGTAADLRAADPRLGSWTLISAQSSIDPPNRLSIVSAHGEVHVVMSGQSRLDFTVKGGGHGTPVGGNPAFNEVELRRIDKRQAEVTEKKDGSIVATVREKLSTDGKELTITTATGGKPDRVTVWTRSGGARAAGDPISGDWTQDLSKTRMLQGLQLRIEPEGPDGVRFAGDFSYAAHFDGKAYDLKNSRNDTVTLRWIDPHTVSSLYRRDDQISEKDIWTVSADGQLLTQTTSGTLETGQRVTEKLVFKKQ
jgi:hypothetical protein